jgi:hypothetical protein
MRSEMLLRLGAKIPNPRIDTQLLKTTLPIHPLTQTSEGGDSWADAHKDEISKAIADFPSQANTALPGAIKI